MVKALHIVLGLQVGGLEKFVLDLTDCYSDRVQSTILCLNDPVAAYKIKTKTKVVRWQKGEGLTLALVKDIVKLIRADGYNIIHTHNPSPHLYGALAGFLAGVPVIHTKHGRNAPGNFKKVLLNKIAAFFTQRVVAVSVDAADVCRNIERISSAKVITILNGVDTQRFSPGEDSGLRIEIGQTEDIPIIGIVARLSTEKNHFLLLDACKLLSEKGTGFHLVIVGDGPLRNELRERVSELHLETEVTFLGMRQDISTLIKAFDVFALPSKTEGISLTLLEAMGCCIPVVATKVGGNPEVVDDGVTGYITSLDAQDFASKLDCLLNNSDLRIQMGLAGRKRVMDRFSLSRAAENYIAVYRELLKFDHA